MAVSETILMRNPQMAVSSQIFRNALSRFATGVTVVTLSDPEAPLRIHGMTANSFASVSLDPLLVLVCIGHAARTHALAQQNRRFGISVLAEHQQSWSRYFAQVEQHITDADRLGVKLSYTVRGTPVLEGALVQLDCRFSALHQGGDHSIFVAEVDEVWVAEGRPLLFYHHKYYQLGRAEN